MEHLQPLDVGDQVYLLPTLNTTCIDFSVLRFNCYRRQSV